MGICRGCGKEFDDNHIFTMGKNEIGQECQYCMTLDTRSVVYHPRYGIIIAGREGENHSIYQLECSDENCARRNWDWTDKYDQGTGYSASLTYKDSDGKHVTATVINGVVTKIKS